MVEVIVSRIPAWQSKALAKYRKSKKASVSDIVRFAFNYLLLYYSGRINAQILDETDFLARQKFTQKSVILKPRKRCTVKRK